MGWKGVEGWGGVGGEGIGGDERRGEGRVRWGGNELDQRKK